jgi:radical SAM protein with 4Fe4S-binding SPASM domain
MIHRDTDAYRLQLTPYPAIFYKKTGQFIRGDDPKTGADPFLATEMPEMLDISITGKCTGPNGTNCDFCYRRATPDGEHMTLENLNKLLDWCKGHFVCQIALGGGNPPLHPQFPEVLRMIHDAGIIPNYTYNGRDLTDEGLWATKAFCGAVAVSHYDHELCMSECARLIEAEIKTNIHFVLSNKTIGEAADIIDGSVKMPDGLNAIVFLTHKAVGWGTEDDLLDPNSREFKRFIQELRQNGGGRPFKIGFDSCFASALVQVTDIDPVLYDFCEAGRFSAFISEDMKFYPCSFTEDKYEGGIDLLEMEKEYIRLQGKSYTLNPLAYAWKAGECFEDFRDWLSTKHCECEYLSICQGGCPINGAAYCGLKEERKYVPED